MRKGQWVCGELKACGGRGKERREDEEVRFDDVREKERERKKNG